MRTSNMNKYGCEMGVRPERELVALDSAASMRRKIYALMRKTLDRRYVMGRCWNFKRS